MRDIPIGPEVVLAEPPPIFREIVWVGKRPLDDSRWVSLSTWEVGENAQASWSAPIIFPLW